MHSRLGIVGLTLAVAVCGSLFAAAPASAQVRVFINELHYDNSGTDADEQVEIAGPAGTDLSGFSLAFYGGADGALYATVPLSGTLPGPGCLGALAFAQLGFQNGPADGVALVGPGGVLQFLSHEGSLVAVDGPAMGMTSTDIGVLEDSLSPVGNSLQLEGLGLTYDDFSWAGATNAASWGALNAGQRAHCPFINELHYDNAGTDVNERVEIAGRAGTDLTGFSLVFYNGATLAQYGVLALSGVLPDQQAGMGTLSFAQAVIQNGAPDGLALVNDAGAVIQFLSYEGSFTAADGPPRA